MFADAITQEELKVMMEKPDAQKDALNTLKKLDPDMIVQTLMNAV